MELALVIILPPLLVYIGYALTTGKALTPNAVTGSILVYMRLVVRWLWRERHPRSGAGRINQPRIWYQPPHREDE